MTAELLDAYRSLIADVFELAGSSRRTSEGIARASGQTAARWHVLSVLSDRPRTAPSAARRLGLARQSVQRVIDDLLGAGLLAASPNPDHVRAPLYSLTEPGRATLQQLSRESEFERSRMLTRAGVSSSEIRAAGELIRRLVAALPDSS